MSPAALIEMANNVQQHAAELQTWENQMMTQFQEVMSMLKQQTASKTLLIPTTKATNARKVRISATTTKAQLNHANTV